MPLRISCLLFFNFLAAVLVAQTCTISGKVVDSKTTQPLVFTSVFINNTTIGTVSDANGGFVLKNILQPGVYELVFSFLGYEHYKTKVSLSTPQLEMGVIKLRPLQTELTTVEVKASRDLEWEKKLKKFKKVFLGDDNDAKQCEILNPWVIDFADDPLKKKIIATAQAPIEIENRALGYKVNFYLISFVADNSGYQIKGNVHFEPLKIKNHEMFAQWEQNRERSYYQSSQHLFKAIVDHRISGEGFNLYTEKPRSENSIIRTSPLFKHELGLSVHPCDTTNIVSLTDQKDIFRISLTGRLEVHYTNEKASKRIYQDVNYPVSWITSPKNFILVTKDGSPLSQSDVILAGAMSNDRVAHMLPVDYQPLAQLLKRAQPEQETQLVESLYENIYIHTDKGYYYPGEALWFKGYINYTASWFRDSLSRTVYVEFIHGPARKVLLSKTFFIDSGTFFGDFNLPDTLKSSDCYLRAYTNFCRNFGDENLYVKYIPILNPSAKPEPLPNVQALLQDSLEIITDKESYSPREKITLSVQVQNEDKDPKAAFLSLSVTHLDQVVPLSFSTILSDFPIPRIPPIKNTNRQIEYGVGFTGKFIARKKGKLEKGLVNIFQMNPRSFYASEVDNHGIFSLANLNFYDTSRFFFQVKRGKTLSFENPELLTREIPPIVLQASKKSFKIVETQLPQRKDLFFQLPKGSRLLPEVVVKARKIEEHSLAKERPYGLANYVINHEDINTTYGNLLMTLPGKVPGLVVRQAFNPGEPPRWVVYIQRSASQSVNFPREVTVLINNVVVGGEPGDILGAIDPRTVESIEVTTRLNSLLGSQGCCGVVNIFTKTDIQINQSENIPYLKVTGYNRPKEFTSPVYDGTNSTEARDFRSLIYWNPNVNTDRKKPVTVSFYAADDEGQYQIIVEGVTEDGKPVHSERVILVKK